MSPTDEAELLGSARAKQRALANLARPVARSRGPYIDRGDGDHCPLVHSHGRMYVLPSKHQYCAHQTHDGTDQAFWPLFIEPVKKRRPVKEPSPLPDIEIGDLTW